LLNRLTAHDDQAKSCWKAGLLSRVEYIYSISKQKRGEERRGEERRLGTSNELYFFLLD
jgi:hypothetical protein